MDRFKEMSCFVAVASQGSLSAVARSEGVTPAVIGRRLDMLEARLGVRLLTRSTRRISLTTEGIGFLEHCQRILDELKVAEASASQGRTQAVGHLKITAPAGFGRRHIAPIVQRFLATHNEISVNLELTDRIVDLAAEGFDCAIRFGPVNDTGLVAVKLAENRRVLVASPEYLAQKGTPSSLRDLNAHDCLLLSHQRGWILKADPARIETIAFQPKSRYRCSDGAVLHDWALDGLGIAWRSWWEVAESIACGQLISVLDELAAPPVAINALLPAGATIHLHRRLFLDALKDELPSTLNEVPEATPPE